MPRNLYIAAAEPRSGKSLVVVGVLEFLAGKGGRLGFFRPVIRTEEVPDMLISLVRSRYSLDLPYDAMFGCTHETARELILEGRYDDLLGRILEKYRALESHCDFIVCAGTDYTGVAHALELDFNMDVANNIASPVLPVARGLDRSGEQAVNAARALVESLRKKRCDILAVVVNRVASGLADPVLRELKHEMPAGTLLYALPEHPFLGKPTVGEVSEALGAELISGDEEGLQRLVTRYTVAAMELPNFLDHVEDGSLIITPGDRSDIILGSLLADEAETYPQIAGLLLSGNLRPTPQVRRLLEGLMGSPVPVLGVATDTFRTAMECSAVEGTLAPESRRKMAAALGVVEANINMRELEERLSVGPSGRVTPLMFEYDLIQRAKGQRRHIVLPEGTDERILRAAEVLLLRDVVDVTLIGKREEVLQRAEVLALSLEQADIINPLESDLRGHYADQYYRLRRHKGISEQMAFDEMADVNYFGTMMVHAGAADGMVSGAVHTTQHTIRPALQIIKTKPGCSIVSSVFFMCLADRVLVYGDCAINQNPTAEQLADIAVSSAETARMFGIEPRVAMLSYSTGESGKGEDVERVREATRMARERGPHLLLEGPIQYDAAVDANVARAKMPGSTVAGKATVLIFPDLNTGNNTYKAVQRSAEAVAIGPVLQGLNKPVNDLSRGCSVTDIVNTVAITAIQSQENQRPEGDDARD
jgi:phosphate acetyltransferase